MRSTRVARSRRIASFAPNGVAIQFQHAFLYSNGAMKVARGPLRRRRERRPGDQRRRTGRWQRVAPRWRGLPRVPVCRWRDRRTWARSAATTACPRSQQRRRGGRHLEDRRRLVTRCSCTTARRCSISTRWSCRDSMPIGAVLTRRSTSATRVPDRRHRAPRHRHVPGVQARPAAGQRRHDGERVEFHHAAFDRYFLTGDPAEIDALDRRAHGSRTRRRDDPSSPRGSNALRHPDPAFSLFRAAALAFFTPAVSENMWRSQPRLANEMFADVKSGARRVLSVEFQAVLLALNDGRVRRRSATFDHRRHATR